MRIDARCLPFAPVLGLCLAAMPAPAFEPGTRHVCVPSSDGQTFECRDTSAAADAPGRADSVPAVAPDAAEADPVDAAGPAPAPAPAPASVPMTEPSSGASRPPSYLLQRPSSTGMPLQARTPAPAAVSEPASGGEPAPVSATEAGPVAGAPEAAGAKRSDPFAVDDEPRQPASTAAQASPLPASAPAASPPAEPQDVGSDAGIPDSAEAETAIVTAAASAPKPAAPALMPRADLLGADEFAGLPGTHYTLVLASVRDPATLDALIAAMADRPGALYLLKLGMPDGDWYSLCWAEFDDVEAARAARVQLPDEASLSSGWPRRIGLLQAEIAKKAPSR